MTPKMCFKITTQENQKYLWEVLFEPFFLDSLGPSARVYELYLDFIYQGTKMAEPIFFLRTLYFFIVAYLNMKKKTTRVCAKQQRSVQITPNI